MNKVSTKVRVIAFYTSDQDNERFGKSWVGEMQLGLFQIQGIAKKHNRKGYNN